MQGTEFTSNKNMTLDEIVTAYEKKYGDTFTVVAADSEVWTAPYSEIVLRSDKLGEEIVIWYHEDGRLTDNYMPIKFRPEVEAAVQPLAEQTYGKCIVSNSPIGYGIDEFTPDMNVKEYMSDPLSSMMMYIAVTADPEQAEMQISAFASLLAEHKILTDICVYYYDTLDGVSATHTYGTPFTQKENARYRAFIDKDYQVIDSDWSG